MLDRFALDPKNGDGEYGGDGAKFSQWLENDLIQHNESTFKILALHPNPLYYDLFNLSHSSEFDSLIDVAKKYHINAIFCGHTHVYATQYFNGTVFQATENNTNVDEICMTIGIGGNSKDEPAGYCQVDVTENALYLRPRLINGTWLNSLCITKK